MKRIDGMRKGITKILLAATLIACAAPARAIELNHYQAGMPNMDDFFLPPPAAGRLIYAQYNLYYGTDTIRDFNGDKIDQVTVSGPLGQTRTIDVDFNLDAFYIVPSLMWAPRFTVLGARVGGFVLLPVGNPSLAADLTTKVGLGKSIDDSTWDIGDLYAQPIWLMWSWRHIDLTAGYGFDAPTGKYEGGATDNVGLGFWEHQIQNAIRLHFDDSKTLSVVAASNFEIAHDKEDADVTPGAHWTFNWGVRKSFLHEWAQVGVLGYDAWQISNDHGDDVTVRHQDEVHAAGVQIGIPKLGLAVKYLHEFKARDRFEGQVVSIFFALPLDVIAQKLGIVD